MKKLFALGMLAGLVVFGLGSEAQALTFEVSAVGTSPLGEYGETGAAIKASDVFNSGFGLLVGGWQKVNDHVASGFEVGYYTNSGEDSDAGLKNKLGTIPLHAFIEFTPLPDSAVGIHIRAGAGITRHSGEVAFQGLEESANQTSFSLMFGAGVSYQISDQWGVIAGLRYHEPFTGVGELWDQGDNPSFLMFTLGARFERE